MAGFVSSKKDLKLLVRLTAWAIVSSLTLATRPRLWPIALIQLRALARSDWAKQVPFLPIPDIEYLRFRMETVYGTPDALPPSKDLVEYLAWCRIQRQLWV